MSNERVAPSSVPGGGADHPAQIPARGWAQVLRRAWGEVKTHNVALLSGGVAFFAFLALFPALIAGISLVALVADPAKVWIMHQRLFQGKLPGGARVLSTTDGMWTSPS